MGLQFAKLKPVTDAMPPPACNAPTCADLCSCTGSHPHPQPGVLQKTRSRYLDRPRSGPHPGAAGYITAWHPQLQEVPAPRPAPGRRPSSTPRPGGLLRNCCVRLVPGVPIGASFNSGGMTIPGRPAGAQRDRVWRSCRRARPPPVPARPSAPPPPTL